MDAYYEDGSTQLYLGDCLDVLPALSIEAAVLLTDPPYFKVKPDDWDRQWKQSSQFLAWLGEVIDASLPLLLPSATAWVFAGPALVSQIERDVVGPRMRVLNSVRWVKADSMHNRAHVPSLRRYMTAWEGIILAEQFADVYEDQSFALHQQVFAPLGRYIREERESAGLSRKDVARTLSGYKNLESATANVSNWELGKNLISLADYASVRDALNGSGGEYLTRAHEDLRRECEELRVEFETLRREHEHLRRPFYLDRATGPVSDVWNFPSVEYYPGKHPCEKPQSMLRHMIETTSRPGDLILDPFAGSGSTARAARATGRRSVLIEKDERYCEALASKLQQEADQGDLFAA